MKSQVLVTIYIMITDNSPRLPCKCPSQADYLRLNAELEEQAASLLSEATKLNASFDANKTG